MSSRKFPPKQKPKNKQFNTDKFLLERKQQKIAWNFHLLEFDHAYYGWTLRKLMVYVKKLVDRYEDKTISEIERASGNNHNHFWGNDDLKKLDPDLQKILSKKFKDQAQVFQFQLTSKVRVWGIVEGNIFNIVCLDEEHKGYKTKKKNT